MPIATLTSDYGNRDYHTAMVKAKLLKCVKGVDIVDISHGVKPFCIKETALILNASYPYFPEGTVHLIGVAAEATPHQKHLLVKQNNHYFIGADNGVFSLLEGGDRQQVFEIKHDLSYKTIAPMRDVFTDVAGQILNNKSLSSIGDQINHVKEFVSLYSDMSQPSEIIGRITYIDQFGNLMTNISRALFDEKAQGRSFTIYISSVRINQVFQRYSDFVSNLSEEKSRRANLGKALAVFNSIGYLEIALYRSDPRDGGSASSLLGMNVGNTFKIVFE